MDFMAGFDLAGPVHGYTCLLGGTGELLET